MNVFYSLYIAQTLVAASIFFGYVFTAQTNKRLGKRYRHRWLHWYGRDVIAGEPSKDYKAYMLRSNLILLSTWIFTLLAVSFALMSIY